MEGPRLPTPLGAARHGRLTAPAAGRASGRRRDRNPSTWRYLLIHEGPPLAAWFAAIHLIVTAKNGISPVELERRLGVRQATAWTTKQKIMAAMARREGNKPLSGRVEMDDACPGGARSGGKRGRGAPGKTPFVAAIRRFCHRVNHVYATNFDSR